jgi:hypothetical protein
MGGDTGPAALQDRTSDVDEFAQAMGLSTSGGGVFGKVVVDWRISVPGNIPIEADGVIRLCGPARRLPSPSVFLLLGRRGDE